MKLIKFKNEETKYLQKKLLFFCFTLLQNATNLKQFEDLIINIFNIFNNQYYGSRVRYSLFMIRDQLKHRELHKLKNFDTYEDQQDIYNENNQPDVSKKMKSLN